MNGLRIVIVPACEGCDLNPEAPARAYRVQFTQASGAPEARVFYCDPCAEKAAEDAIANQAGLSFNLQSEVLTITPIVPTLDEAIDDFIDDMDMTYYGDPSPHLRVALTLLEKARACMVPGALLPLAVAFLSGCASVERAPCAPDLTMSPHTSRCAVPGTDEWFGFDGAPEREMVRCIIDRIERGVPDSLGIAVVEITTLHGEPATSMLDVRAARGWRENTEVPCSEVSRQSSLPLTGGN